MVRVLYLSLGLEKSFGLFFMISHFVRFHFSLHFNSSCFLFLRAPEARVYYVIRAASIFSPRRSSLFSITRREAKTFSRVRSLAHKELKNCRGERVKETRKECCLQAPSFCDSITNTAREGRAREKGRRGFGMRGGYDVGTYGVTC